MVKNIFVCDSHLNDLVHIYTAKKNMCGNESSLQLARVLINHLVFFQKHLILQVPFLPANLRKDIKKIECSKNFLTYVDKY